MGLFGGSWACHLPDLHPWKMKKEPQHLEPGPASAPPLAAEA